MQEKDNGKIKTTIINQDRYYKVQSLLTGTCDGDYYEDISMRVIDEFFDSFNNNQSNISVVFNKSKALKDMITKIYKELKNENKVNTAMLQAWFDIGFEKANKIYEKLQESGITIKKYGIMIGNEEKLTVLEKYL